MSLCLHVLSLHEHMHSPGCTGTEGVIIVLMYVRELIILQGLRPNIMGQGSRTVKLVSASACDGSHVSAGACNLYDNLCEVRIVLCLQLGGPWPCHLCKVSDSTDQNCTALQHFQPGFSMHLEVALCILTMRCQL